MISSHDREDWYTGVAAVFTTLLASVQTPLKEMWQKLLNYEWVTDASYLRIHWRIIKVETQMSPKSSDICTFLVPFSNLFLCGIRNLKKDVRGIKSLLSNLYPVLFFVYQSWDTANDALWYLDHLRFASNFGLVQLEAMLRVKNEARFSTL